MMDVREFLVRNRNGNVVGLFEREKDARVYLMTVDGGDIVRLRDWTIIASRRGERVA